MQKVKWANLYLIKNLFDKKIANRAQKITRTTWCTEIKAGLAPKITPIVAISPNPPGAKAKKILRPVSLENGKRQNVKSNDNRNRRAKIIQPWINNFKKESDSIILVYS